MPVAYPLPMPPGAVMMLVIFLLPMLIVVPFAWWQGKQKSRNAAIGSVAVVGSVGLLMLYLMVIAPMQTKAVIDDGLIIVRTPPYATLRISGGDIQSAYLADWRETQQLAPATRTGGAAIADYKTGKFRLRNGADAVIMAVGSKVLVLELADKLVLLAPGDFNTFVGEFEKKVVSLSPIPAEIRSPAAVGPRSFFSGDRIIMMIIGLFLIVAGYLIRFKKMLWLLSGYNEKSVKNKDALARFAGNALMLIGLFFMIVQFFGPKAIIIYSIALIPFSLYMIVKMNTL